MLSCLNSIRNADNKLSLAKAIIHTIGIMLFGIGLGTLSKYLDCTASNELPRTLEYLDVRNFLGRLDIWIFIAVCISVYSTSAKRASVNVFVFFSGMVASYYLYSNYIAGFFPKSYAMIWIGLTIVSPLLSFICWYAKGMGKVALAISVGIIAVLFNLSFSYGMGYFDIRSPLELLVFICGVIVLRRTAKETIIMLGMGAVFAFILDMIIPFHFG
jgi:hypothetical protein